MDFEGVCYKEKLRFLKYLNADTLIYCITSLAFLGVGFLLYVLSTFTFFEKRKIPRGNLPSFPYGNIKDVLCYKIPFYLFLWRCYQKFKRKGHKICGLFLFLKPAVLVMDQQILNAVLTEDKIFIDVNDNKKLQTINWMLDKNTLDRFIKEYNNLKDGLMTELKNQDAEIVLRNYFIETISLAFGFNSCEILDEINELLKKKTEANFRRYLEIAYPIFQNRSSFRNLRDMFLEITETRKKNDIRKHDFLQGVIDLANSENLTVDDVVSDVFDSYTDSLIFSYDITLFCLYELGLNNDIQEELIGEIRRFNKENAQITLDNLQNLTYLDAVVKETLRKYPPVPTILKKLARNYKIPELQIDLPKGLLLFVSTFSLQRDPTNFTDPLNFDPDRFSDENKKFSNPNSFIPFGCGRRNEIGMRYITLTIKLGLLSVFSRFKVTHTNELVQFDAKKTTIHPAGPQRFKFESL